MQFEHSIPRWFLLTGFLHTVQENFTGPGLTSTSRAAFTYCCAWPPASSVHSSNHVSDIQIFVCIVPDEPASPARMIWSGDGPWIKCGELYWGLIVLHAVTYMMLQNLFWRAAPFIVLSSSFAQRSLYKAHNKSVVWCRHWHTWKRCEICVSERESLRMTCKAWDLVSLISWGLYWVAEKDSTCSKICALT